MNAVQQAADFWWSLSIAVLSATSQESSVHFPYKNGLESVDLPQYALFHPYM